MSDLDLTGFPLTVKNNIITKNDLYSVGNSLENVSLFC